MKVAVVIPSLKKNYEYLKTCVESLRATTDWEIIVVLNGDEIGDDITNFDLPCRKFFVKQQGQCRAVNVGVGQVSPDTDYILISNDDMYYAPGWNKNLRFDHLVFSPNLVEPENNNGSAPPFLKCDGGFTLDEFKREDVDRFVGTRTGALTVSIGEGVAEETGFNFPVFIRKDVWDTIGGYDVNYDPWGSNSDTDLQTKIELAGIQPVRLRDVLVYHFSNKSGTFDGTHQEEWWKNWHYYTNKWGFNRDDEPIPDTWLALRMVNKEKNKFHPEWEGKYKDAEV